MAQPSRILFVHDNYPAQFGALGLWLVRAGWEVTFATAAAAAKSDRLRILHYAPHRQPSGETHPYAQPMDRAAINGQAFVRTALAARAAGYKPDVIVAHSGWGAGMFAKDVFPEARYIAYCEWWYRHPGLDVSFLAEISGEPDVPSIEGPMRERARNAPIAMDLSAADAALCPTRFQADQFPRLYRDALTVQHDGIDTEVYAPDAAGRRSTLGGLVAEDARVVTYATRGMEPHRGFPQFMAALPRILAADPKTVAVVAGENRVAYGGSALRRTDWKAQALAENDIDPARVHFVGLLARPDYLRLLRRANAHIYLTVPFVLSWSMLEAMSTACPLVLSDTAPVHEFADENCARLVAFRDSSAITEAVRATLDDPAEASRRAAAARARIEESLSIRAIYPQKAHFFSASRA